LYTGQVLLMFASSVHSSLHATGSKPKWLHERNLGGGGLPSKTCVLQTAHSNIHMAMLPLRPYGELYCTIDN
jgi:hypothetical protein